MNYTPFVGEELRLTDGTRIVVRRINSQGYFTAERADGQMFTTEQTGCPYREAAWQFNGQRGMNDRNWPSKGLSFIMPITKARLEKEVADLGGSITWTDPNLIKARAIWAKHARPSGGSANNSILRGEVDTGPVMQAILEALRTKKGN
jgi:hypothetical protein